MTPPKPPLPRSLTRMDSLAPPPEPRERARTFNCMLDADSSPSSLASPLEHSSHTLDMADKDVFDQSTPSDDDDDGGADTSAHPAHPAHPAHHAALRSDESDPSTPYDQLPIELLSMIDRFVNSLSAKSYTSPPSIDRISDLFQNFYLRANDHISTHIASLASRHSRDPSPPHSSSRHSNDTTTGTNDRQMLTPTEVTQRRKSRKYLQQKRIAMEEAVEKRVCEAVYKKIWRHKTTMDEVRDEKLRSKTAALTVVGIDLKDLGIDIADSSEETQKKINESLETARQCLAAMNDEKYPLGKLQHLTAAHKAIVDTLTNVFPSSSSADEILPTLIYTLITGPPEGINTISNFLFIQRFRTAAKIDGEAAYCLTNLEAAISFLENVDLSSLRADEAHTSAPSFASGSDLDDTAVAKPPSTAVAVAGSGSGSQGSARSSSRLSLPARSAQSPSRRLSDLFQPPAKVLGAANDAVRSTADQGLKNFTATLDNSFKFFLGRLNESQEKSPIAHAVVPKTLDEARLLVSPPVHADKDLDGDEALSVGDVLGAQPPPQSEQSEPATTTAATTTATPSSPSSLPPVPPRTSNAPSVEDRFIGLIGGRKPQQRVGVDIAEGMRPPRRVVSDNTTATTITGSSATTVSTSTSTSFFQSNSSTTNAFTSMKSFGNSLNPLSHIPDMIRGFGKNPEAEKEKEKKQEVEEEKKKKKQKQKRDQPPSPEPSSSPAPEPRKNLTDIKPPIRRFVELQDPSQLTLADIPELLEDYKRLALVVDELST